MQSNPCKGPKGSRSLRLPDLHDNRHMKVVKLSAQCTRHLYAPRNILVARFCYTLSWCRSIAWSEGIHQKKIPLTPLGIEPVTFWLVAQYLNQLWHHVHIFLPSVRQKQMEGNMLVIKTLNSTRGISRRATAISKAKDYHTKAKWWRRHTETNAVEFAINCRGFGWNFKM